MAAQTTQRERAIWDFSPATFPPATERLVFLSGLSDPHSCALTTGQRDLLQGLPFPASNWVPYNFPFVVEKAEERPSIPLWRASLNNVRQYLALSKKPFVDRCLPHWLSLTRSTERLAVVTLSCGLELVAACLKAQQQLGETKCEVRILALGPVARRLPTVSCFTICGSSDWLARWYFPKPNLMLRGLKHLDYVQSPLIRERISEWLSDNTFASAGAVAICRPRSSLPTRSTCEPRENRDGRLDTLES